MLQQPISNSTRLSRHDAKDVQRYYLTVDAADAGAGLVADVRRMTLNPEDFETQANTLKTGASFHRCALQVNPYHYLRTFQGQEAGGDAHAHADTVLAKASEMRVSVLAITDHNDVSGIQPFQKAAEQYGVTILPGFEISSLEGIHVLCIYLPGTPQQTLERFLGEFGIRKTQPSSELSSRPFTEVLAKVREQDGIAVAAHITNASGLFRVLKGKARIQPWKSNDLLAVQIPAGIADLPQKYRSIVENMNPDYRRTHPADENLAIAVVNAKDINKPDDMEDPSATCWIKMSEVSVEGLRQAFLDPGSRIRLNDSKQKDSDPEEHGALVALRWEGGFLDGVAVRLNSNLNVLVGGRGTGKSTVIESLRYVLDLDPIGEEANITHNNIVHQVLKSGTKVSLIVRRNRPTTHQYRIDRTVPNPPIVRDESGDISSLSPAEVLPRVEVYGQHEVSELTRSKKQLTRLLDRFVAHDQDLARRKSSIRQDLEKSRRSILYVTNELALIEDRLATLPGLEETLERFRKAGLEDRLRERSLLVREEQVLESVPEHLRPFRESLEDLRQELPVDRAFLSEKALERLPGREILAGADHIFERLGRDVEDAANRLEKALARTDEGIAAIRLRWNERKQEVQQAYEKILRQLQKSAVDGAEYIRLRKEVEGLRPLRERRSLLRQLERTHLNRRKSLLAEWEDVKAEEFRLLDQAARKVDKKLTGRVRVAVTAAGDRKPLIEVLRNEVGGRLSEALEVLSNAQELSLSDFVARCRSGAEDVQRQYPMTLAQANRLAEADPKALMLIEEIELLSTTTIQLNTASSSNPPEWQALEDLSTGQKATAVLLLLLLESDAPLIVDQPEDDLDNRFITEGIVPRMRAEKRQRQFIFSTHNANIPVLGDAELILGLTAGGRAGPGRACIASEHRGSIDNQSVRELVEDILEGGRDAFETRRLKYGF